MHRALLQRARIYNLTGKNQQAHTDLRHAMEVPQHADNLMMHAECLSVLCEVYASLSEFKRMQQTAQKAMRFFGTIKDPRGLADCHINIGYANDYRGNHRLALKHYRLALKKLYRVHYSMGRAIIYNNMGRAYNNMGNTKKAMRYYRKAAAVCRQHDDLDSQARTLNNIGAMYHGLGNYEEALVYYSRAARMHEQTGNREDLAVVFNNIGNTYIRIRRYQHAREYLEQSYRIKNEIGNNEGSAIALSNLGNLLRILGDYDGAIERIQQSLLLVQKAGNNYVETYNYIRLCWINIDRGRAGEIGTYIKKVGSLSRRYPGKDIQCQSALIHGWYLLYTGKSTMAIARAREALQLATQSFFHHTRAQALLLLHCVYKTRNNCMQARRMLTEIIHNPHVNGTFEQAKAYYYLAALHASKQEQRTDHIRNKARNMFSNLGLDYWVKRVDRDP